MSKETYLHLKRELITERETLTQVASMAVEGMPAEEIDEFRGKLAHRMLHEFEHEGFSKKALKKQNKVLSFNASGKHYYIFDEVDNLTKTAQAGLKTTLNSQRGIFILTTNNISQLDKGVKDRCVLVEMNAAIDAEYLPLTRRIAADENVVLNDTDKQALVATCKGSIRNLTHQTMRHVLRMKGAAANAGEMQAAA